MDNSEQKIILKRLKAEIKSKSVYLDFDILVYQLF